MNKNLRTVLRIIGIVLFVGLLFATLTIFHFEKRLIIGFVEQSNNSIFFDTSTIDTSIDKPGELLRSQRLYSAPDGITGWKILYRSTDRNGAPILASGLVATPSEQLGKTLPIVAWGHPTTGIAPNCAPSASVDPFDSIEGLRDIIKNGYTVVAADYSGMGVVGPQSFLIGESEGRTILDSVRAAQQLPSAHRTDDVVFWGHSQGGHASLFASQIANEYAPEFSIKGVALAAPATDLAMLIKADIGSTAGVTIGSYAFHAYSESYNEDLRSVLSEPAIKATKEAAPLCLVAQNKQIHAITEPLIGKYLIADPQTTEPWASILTENTPTGPTAGTPMFIAQGEKDQLIKPTITRTFADSQQARGIPLTYHSLPDATHGTVALESIPNLVTWLNNL